MHEQQTTQFAKDYRMYGVIRFSLLIALMGLSVANAQQREPFIINGTTSDLFPAVGIVGEASVGGFCTGTLISPTHVLTAAHCAEALLEFGSEDSGTFEVGGRIYRTSSVEIISSYDNRRLTDDVAILVLEEPVPDIEPAIMSDIPPEVGETVMLVGFGGRGTAETGSDGSFGQQLVGMTTVDGVTESEFFWVFDDPEESNSAPGDSGGPIFIDTGETLLLAGIVSSGTRAEAQLGDTSFNMRVDAFSGWIGDTVAATTMVAAEVPIEDPAAEEEEPPEELPSEELEEEPVEEESPQGEPVVEEPTEELPTTEEPTAPGVEQPVTEEPITETPVTEDSGCNRGGGNGHRRPGSYGHGSHHGESAVSETETTGTKAELKQRRPYHPRNPGRRPASSYRGRNSSRYFVNESTPRSRGVNVRRR